MSLLPKCCWLRFSIRTLLLAVTIVCFGLGWAAREMSIASERQALRELVDFRGGVFEPSTTNCGPEMVEPPSISWVRQFLGDRIEPGLRVPLIVMTEKEMQRIRRAFPELHEIEPL